MNRPNNKPKQRLGITIPFPGQLHQQRPLIEELQTLGYTDAWTGESDAFDGLTPLALASTWAPQLRLGTAILPVYTRGPALLAQSAATMASAAPGRFVLGIGTSSNVIVNRWNATDFDQPYMRVRDTIRFLREAFSGEKVTNDYETFSIKGFRLGVKVPEPVPIYLAALREQMLRLAAREADGVITNWISPADARGINQIVTTENPNTELVSRLFVIPTANREEALRIARFLLAAYINVDVYKAFHIWLGRGDALAEHWAQWDAGDRKGSLNKIPESVIDDLLIHGSVEQCRAKIEAYQKSGVHCPVLMILPTEGQDHFEVVRALGQNPPS